MSRLRHLVTVTTALASLMLAVVPGASPASAQSNVVTPNWPALTITPSGGSPVTISANGLMTTHANGYNDYTGANFPYHLTAQVSTRDDSSTQTWSLGFSAPLTNVNIWMTNVADGADTYTLSDPGSNCTWSIVSGFVGWTLSGTTLTPTNGQIPTPASGVLRCTGSPLAIMMARNGNGIGNFDFMTLTLEGAAPAPAPVTPAYTG